MRRIFLILLLFLLLPSAALAASKTYRVLVVFSYEEDFLWDRDIRQGFAQAAGDAIDFDYFYLQTKKYPEHGGERAAAAYKRFLKLRPDGVIAVDDNAQSLFVVPYLRDKVATPVMFCGVNAEPQSYGYPAKNVSGVLERYHYKETIAFSRQFVPDIKRFVFMAKAGTTADLIEQQLRKELEQHEVAAELVAFLRPKTAQEALALARQYREKSDLLIVETLQGVTDEAGRPLVDAEIVPEVLQAFNKPTAANIAYIARLGALASVVKTGQEQGRKAVEMLLLAMRGTPVAKIPVTRNYRGKRIVNVSTMKKLGIVPNAIALRGVELVRSK